MDKITLKNIIIVVIVVAAAFFVYSTVIKTDVDEAVLVSERVEDSEASKEVGGLIEILRDLKRLKLDTTIFADEAFLKLRDFSVIVAPQPQGRENPFAPLE